MVILDRSFDRLCNKVFQPFPLAYFSILTIFSVKLIGLFVTALVGVYTIEDLWEKFGDIKMPIVSLFLRIPYPELVVSYSSQRDHAKHWGARIFCLIIVPILVYMASFKIHFLILNHSGPGDAQMSSLFQANLEGNDFAQNPLGMVFIFEFVSFC
jgi:dolichyl-phosphate-mannose-protein mannosyltransferase